MQCISCDKVHEENFCPNCGERKGIERITFSSILNSFFSSITSMDRGFLYNCKTLFLNPKKITIDFIRGNRRGIFNPVSYLIFSITIYILVITFMHVPPETSDVDRATLPEYRNAAYATGQFVRRYIKFFWIFTIIPLGLSLKLVFRKYNLAEYLAISSFIVGQATLVGIISYLLTRIPLVLDPLVYVVIFWLVYKTFKVKNEISDSLLLTFCALVLFIIQLILILAILIGGKMFMA